MQSGMATRLYSANALSLTSEVESKMPNLGQGARCEATPVLGLSHSRTNELARQLMPSPTTSPTDPIYGPPRRFWARHAQRVVERDAQRHAWLCGARGEDSERAGKGGG